MGAVLIVNLIRWLVSEEIWQNKGARVASLLFLALVVSVVNGSFGRSLIVEYYIGGDADRGKIENGRYYVGNRTEYTEVSRGVYWFTYAYVRASEWAVWLSLVAFLLFFFWAARFHRRKWTKRLCELRQGKDLEALHELIDLMDHPDLGFRSPRLTQPVIDPYELRAAIREKTDAVMNREANPLSLSFEATQEELERQKATWLAWAKSHEAELCGYLAGNPVRGSDEVP
jgi:hypothetical protein